MTHIIDLKMVETFLYREARLLDDQEWQAWADLFTEGGTYWVPATPGQPDPVNHVSLVYEDKLLRAVRLKRFENPNAFSLQPMPRSTHLISNIELLEDYEPDNIRVRSKFIMLYYRRDKQEIYGGTYQHHLMHDGDSLRIIEKKVELVNCDAALDAIQLYF